jgi:serine/threonine-protein kinase
MDHDRHDEQDGAPMIGRTLSRYEVTEKLGEGGMGVVYKARDTELGRFVAVKLLPESDADPDRRLRLLQEARSASSLNHPNIVTIHEIGRDAGTEFIVMEYVKGATLEDRIAGRALPVEDALRYAVQIADALGAAHAAGIVHRDLKPRNIMVSDEGLVKVLDFGLAKLSAEPDAAGTSRTGTILGGATPVTGAGTILGTVEYMSPEQAEGRSLDPRSDIFSFGAVLYRMLTGELPFQGSSPIAVIAALLRDEPRPVRALAPGVPEALEHVVALCLRKNPAERTSRAVELKAALLEIAATGTSGRHAELFRTGSSGGYAELAASSPSGRHPARSAADALPSIAVLPFANLSPDRENEYFSDGLAEEILNALSRVEGIRVTARTSAFAFRGKELDVRQIGDALNVRTILEGSVRRAGDRVRVTAQLVNVEDGYHLWSERFDRELTDVFAIQDEIAQAIVERLRVRLSASAAPAPRARPGNIEAYNLCLKGRYHLLKLTEDGIARARQYFEAAIALEPEHAYAHSSLGALYWVSGYFGATFPSDAMRVAKQFVLRALELDPGLAAAHAVLGCLLAGHDFDWPGAEAAFARSLALDPTSVDARTMRAFLLLRPLGRVPEAVHEFELALELDPLSAPFHNQLGYLLYLDRQYERAFETCRAAVDIDATYYLSHLTAAVCRMRQRRLDEAMEHVSRAVELNPSSPLVLSTLGELHALDGREQAAREVLARLDAMSAKRYIPPTAQAGVLNALGDLDGAFDAWSRAVELRDAFVLPLKTVPSMDGLRSDPRYLDLIRRMRLTA